MVNINHSSNPSHDAHYLSIHQVSSSPVDLQPGEQTTAPQVDPSPSACQPVPDRSMSPQPTNTLPWSDAVLHQPAVPEAISTPSSPMCGGGPLTTLTTPKRRAPEPNETPHAKLRKVGEDNFFRAANRQQRNFDRQKGAMRDDYAPGDCVGVRIARVDRTNTGVKLLKCKVLEKNSNNRYKLYCILGILTTSYAHTDLIDFKHATFPELDSLDPNQLETVAFTHASRHCSSFRRPSEADSSVCSCKGGCKDNRCSCRKNKLTCSTKCHTEKPECFNK